MSKAYLLVICLLAASFTGCIGDDDLEKITTEEEETVVEEETITPVGEDNLSSLQKQISDLKEIIEAYKIENNLNDNEIDNQFNNSQKRIKDLEIIIAEYEKPHVYFMMDDDNDHLFCEEDYGDCLIIAKAYDINGAIERYKWESSVPNSFDEYDEECYEVGELPECIAVFEIFALEVCNVKAENQTFTLTVYDNDGNNASALYDLDYDAACSKKDDDDNTIRIGFLNPLTGPLEPDAYGFWWGANEAIRDLDAMYQNYNFELVEMNSGCSNSVAAASAQNLIDRKVIAVAGAACSGASMGANEVLSAAGIPMISYASTNPGLSDDEEYPLFYRIVPSDASQGPAGADMMAFSGVGSGELAILHMTNDYGNGLAYSVKEAWEEDGNTLCGAGMQGYVDTTTDFSALADSISGDSTCTAVYLSSYITDAAGIMDELEDDGWNGKIFAGDGPAGVGLYDKMADNATAAELVVSAPRAGTSYGDLEARYDAKASEIGSIKTYVLTIYDVVMMIGKAATMTGSINDNIMDVGTNYEGASGLITFLDNGDVIGSYDICTYSGDTSDNNGGYDCNKYWTPIKGIKQK